MENDLIFFTTNGKGLTSTSANHIANLAKEMILNVETSLEKMELYSTSVALIGDDKQNLLVEGDTEKDLDTVIDRLYKIGKAKALIAWLREAIKAKEKMIKEVKELGLEEYAAKREIELGEDPAALVYNCLLEEDYYASLPIGERCRYYSLEALASTLGKAIHPEGNFAEARNELLTRLKSPHTVEGDGRDTLIYTYTPTVNPEKVETVFFRLQDLYRDVQSKLNAIKQDCQNAVNASSVAAYSKCKEDIAEWNNRRKLLMAEMTEYKTRETQIIASLRIVIPEALSDIYEIVNHLGKNE